MPLIFEVRRQGDEAVMLKAGPSFAVLVMLVGGWAIYQSSHRPGSPSEGEPIRGPGFTAPKEVSPEPASADKSVLETQKKEDQLPEWEYSHLFGKLALEPKDRSWAPGVAATIDSTIRSMGAYISDVKVDCRTSQCGAVILYQRAFFDLDEAAQQAEIVSLLDRFETLKTIVDASPRLTSFSALGLAQVTRDPPTEDSLEDSLGTAVNFTGEPIQESGP